MCVTLTSSNHTDCNTRRQLVENDDYLFYNHVCFGGECVTGTVCLCCVSSKSGRHSSVTQGELLILSQERDVLAPALGSLEDKQRASIAQCEKRRNENDAHREVERRRCNFSHFISYTPLYRGLGPCTEMRLHTTTVFVETRPLVNPVTFRVHPGHSGKNSHVM